MLRTRWFTWLCLMLLAACWWTAGPVVSARAQVGPLVEAMTDLTAHTQDALNQLMRGDFRKLERASDEIGRATDLAMGAAHAEGLAPALVDGLVAMGEDADTLHDAARNDNLEAAAAAYLDIVRACLKCHVAEL